MDGILIFEALCIANIEFSNFRTFFFRVRVTYDQASMSLVRSVVILEVLPWRIFQIAEVQKAESIFDREKVSVRSGAKVNTKVPIFEFT